MNTIKNITSVFIAILAITVGAVIDAKAQTYASVPIPWTTLTGGNTINGGTAANTVTNIVNGWTATTYTTNITQLWSTSASAFVNTTNISTNTTTAYADFEAIGRRYVVLQHEFTCTASQLSNLVMTVSRSVTKGRFDTLNNFTITNTLNGVTPSVGVYQIDMGGYPYGRITSITWASTNQAHIITNLGVYYSTAAIRQGSATAN